MSGRHTGEVLQTKWVLTPRLEAKPLSDMGSVRGLATTAHEKMEDLLDQWVGRRRCLRRRPGLPDPHHDEKSDGAISDACSAIQVSHAHAPSR
mmetsp:Transcript_65764/g.130304  ORF Transcript_65764/g.130304 Transcript_65764/m.130304 type:complete len:93 (-) Transcript_65764:267-545(-)